MDGVEEGRRGNGGGEEDEQKREEEREEEDAARLHEKPTIESKIAVVEVRTCA